MNSGLSLQVLMALGVSARMQEQVCLLSPPKIGLDWLNKNGSDALADIIKKKRNRRRGRAKARLLFLNCHGRASMERTLSTDTWDLLTIVQKGDVPGKWRLQMKILLLHTANTGRIFHLGPVHLIFEQL